MAATSVYCLQKTEDEERLQMQAISTRPARLKSLQYDPMSFSSKYEDEREKPIEFWVNRLRPQWVQHFVLLQSNQPAVEQPDKMGARVIELEQETQVLGFMVLINENQQVRDGDAKATEQHTVPAEFSGLETYYMAAMWVDSSLRGKGAAGRIIQTTIQWILQDAKTRGLKSVLYRTAAFETNPFAIRAYERCGFVIGGEKEPFEDGRFMVNMYQTLAIQQD